MSGAPEIGPSAAPMHSAGEYVLLGPSPVTAVHLDQLARVHIAAECAFHGLEICPVTVRGQLHPVGETSTTILHERHPRTRRHVRRPAS